MLSLTNTFSYKLLVIGNTFFKRNDSLASKIDANSKQMVNIFKKSGIFAAFLEYNKNDVSAISGAMAQGGLL